MALHTFGTTSASALNAIKWYPGLVAAGGSNPATRLLGLGDAQAIDNSIFSATLAAPQAFAATFGAFGLQGILLTVTTNSTTTLGTLAATGGPPLSAIQVGALIRGTGIPPNTFITARTPTTGTPTSLTISQAATTSLTAQPFIIANPNTIVSGSYGFDPATGRIQLPDGRGVIFLNPGDVVAVDNAGAVIVVPLASTTVAGTLWTFT
jgi:hypothetical protein